MYSPTLRLLTILELLQSYGHMSGVELAKRLEVNVRTIRRYIVTLQDMGIPVESERGPYGTYQLRRGYKLPPLMFNDAEAVALAMGLIAIREFRFPLNAAAVEGALAKTERVLPEKLFQQVRGLQEAISFYVSGPQLPLQFDFVTVLSSAVQRCQQVQLRYKAWNGDESERAFDPYGIVFNEGYWYTAGYCHLRRDLRTFRLDRVTLLELIEQPFDQPANFDVLGYVLKSVALLPGTEQIEVFMDTTLEHAQTVIPPIMGTVEQAENGVIFRRAANQLVWIAHILISLDFPIRIIKPVELRDLIREIGLKALQITGDEV